jgi:ketosteroid isomerase-like protein
MNDQQKQAQESGARDQEIRAALDQHWAASDANDFETEHRIYQEDAVLEYPQSGERIRGRRNIQNQRTNQPNEQSLALTSKGTNGRHKWTERDHARDRACRVEHA